VNQVLSLLPSDGWPRIAADVVWQSTLLGIVGLLCARFMARRPATQALVSLVAMLAAVVTPITSVTSRSFGWGMLKPTVIADALSDEDVDAPLPARANPTTNVAAVDQPTRSSGIQSLRQPVKVPTGI
jgi:hypothetical protein